MDGLPACWVICQHSGWSVSNLGGLSAIWVVCQHSGWSVSNLGGLSALWVVCQHSGWSVSTLGGLSALWVVSPCRGHVSLVSVDSLTSQIHDAPSLHTAAASSRLVELIFSPHQKPSQGQPQGRVGTWIRKHVIECYISFTVSSGLTISGCQFQG